MVYTKIVSAKEMNFTKIASQANISPHLISVSDVGNNRYELKIEEYPYMLADMPNRKIYESKIIDLVRKLHSYGIFHGDISEENIVIDPDTNDIRLIDFGLSQFISDINIISYEEYLENPELAPSYCGERSDNPELFPSSLSDVLELEINEVKWLCSH